MLATYSSFQVGYSASNADFNNRKTTTDWSATTAGTVNTDNNSLTVAYSVRQNILGATYHALGFLPQEQLQDPVERCPSVAIFFEFNAYTATSRQIGLTYQWQSSTDGSSYTNIAATTCTQAAVNQTAATYYQWS